MNFSIMTHVYEGCTHRELDVISALGGAEVSTPFVWVGFLGSNPALIQQPLQPNVLQCAKSLLRLILLCDGGCAVLGWSGLGWAGLGFAGLSCNVLCCAVLCCAVLCWAGLGWAGLGWTLLGCAAMECAVLCCAVPCRAE